jgi:hypothetical protein
MKNVLYGALCGALIFGALIWVTPRQITRAAVLAAPPEGRFELVQLHPSSGVEWSGMLDTETGCTWVYTTNNPDDPKITNQSLKPYLEALGQNSWDAINYDATEYTNTLKLKPDKSGVESDYTAALLELVRTQSACARARLQALSAASAR